MKLPHLPDQDIARGTTDGAIDSLQVVHLEVDEVGGVPIAGRDVEQPRAHLH